MYGQHGDAELVFCIQDRSLARHIEEDFRFTTRAEVQHYFPADLIWKPHLCGFEFSQLLDQIDGRVISSHESGHKFQGLVWAPGGTALWLAKHLNENEIENELLVIAEARYADHLLLNELKALENVIAVTTTDSEVLNHLDDYSIDCSILCCSAELLSNYQLIRHYPQLKHNSVIAYDSDRQLSQKGGRYFMNSGTWVLDNQ